jgi:hypothetical protein
MLFKCLLEKAQPTMLFKCLLEKAQPSHRQRQRQRQRRRHPICTQIFLVILLISFSSFYKENGRYIFLLPTVTAVVAWIPSRPVLLLSQHSCAMTVRGGEESEEKDQNQQHDLEENKEKEKIRKKMKYLSAPFRMNEVVQEEASNQQADDDNDNDDNYDNDNYDDADETHNDQDTKAARGILTGGAAALVTTTPSNRKQQIIAPLDTNRVAPLSSSESDEAIIDNEKTEQKEPTTSPRNMTDVAKLWWVNVWTHQLSDIVVEEEMEEEAEDLSTSENEQESTLDMTDIHQHDFLSDDEESSLDYVPVDESGDTIEGNELSSKIEATQIEEVSTASKTDESSPTPSTEVVTMDVSPYVSSGLVGKAAHFRCGSTNYKLGRKVSTHIIPAILFRVVGFS